MTHVLRTLLAIQTVVFGNSSPPANAPAKAEISSISPWATGVTEEETIRKWLVNEATSLAAEGKKDEALAAIERAERFLAKYTKDNDIPQWDPEVSRLYQLAQSKRATLQEKGTLGSDSTGGGLAVDGKLTARQVKELADVRKALKEAGTLADSQKEPEAKARLQTVYKFLDGWVVRNNVPAWHKSVAPLYQQAARLEEELEAATGQSDKGSQTTRVAAVGDPAPPLLVPGLDGKPISSKDLAGKWVVVDFWATWCGPCRAEMPKLEALYERFGQDSRFALVSVSLDTRSADAKNFIAKSGFTWTHGIVAQGWRAPLVKKYGVNAIPTVFLISPEGKIAGRAHASAGFVKVLEKALSGSTTSRPSR